MCLCVRVCARVSVYVCVHVCVHMHVCVCVWGRDTFTSDIVCRLSWLVWSFGVKFSMFRVSGITTFWVCNHSQRLQTQKVVLFFA